MKMKVKVIREDTHKSDHKEGEKGDDTPWTTKKQTLLSMIKKQNWPESYETRKIDNFVSKQLFSMWNPSN